MSNSNTLTMLRTRCSELEAALSLAQAETGKLGTTVDTLQGQNSNLSLSLQALTNQLNELRADYVRVTQLCKDYEAKLGIINQENARLGSYIQSNYVNTYLAGI